MISKRIGVGALCICAIATLVFLTSVVNVNAQMPGKTPATKDVTLTGRVVDFQSFMTGQMPSADAAKCTADCLRAGVPAGLETSEGLIVLGQGVKGPTKTLLPFAYQNVEVHGKLFEKNGVKYVDIASVHEADEPSED